MYTVTVLPLPVTALAKKLPLPSGVALAEQVDTFRSIVTEYWPVAGRLDERIRDVDELSEAELAHFRARGTSEQRAEICRWLHEDLDPAELLAQVVSADPRELSKVMPGKHPLDAIKVQVAAAGELMPYLHGKMPVRTTQPDQALPVLIIIFLRFGIATPTEVATAEARADELQALGKKAHVIGGALEAGELDAKRAILQGLETAMAL